jgi:DNA invertase Pin-like site-specific DNA recombinase
VVLVTQPILRALIYARVSTSHHDQKPEAQIEELRRYCTARGWDISDEIVDHGYSGGTDQRPGLKRLMALVRARNVDVVVVTKLDRFARSLKHLVAALDEFSSLGVLFVSVGDQIDLTTASGRLMLHLLAAFAEFERGLIRERTLAGLAFARSQGKRLGRPKTRPDAEILRLRAQGASYSQIQRQLKISRPSIHRALVAAGGTKTSKIAIGKTVSNQGARHG